MKKFMDKARIKRLMEIRGFLNLEATSVNYEALHKLCKGLDSEEFAKDFEKVNRTVIEFKENYPEIYADIPCPEFDCPCKKCNNN